MREQVVLFFFFEIGLFFFRVCFRFSEPSTPFSFLPPSQLNKNQFDRDPNKIAPLHTHTHNIIGFSVTEEYIDATVCVCCYHVSLLHEYKEMGVYLTSADDVVKGGIGDRGIAEGVGPCARYRQRQGEGKELER